MSTAEPSSAPSSVLEPTLREGLARLGLSLPQLASTRLLAYLHLIAQWNKVYNLTAIRDPEAMLTQHLLDCLAIVPALRRGLSGQGGGLAATRRVLDVGSGAGLPGVVLAICEPGWQVTEFQGLPISVNPELGLDIEGSPHLVKLYFKEDLLSPRVADLAGRMMARVLGDEQDATMAVLDVRRKRLHRLTPRPELDVLLDAEVAAFTAMWGAA